MIRIIVFGERMGNQSHPCYVVGVQGCKGIKKSLLGRPHGLSGNSYMVELERGLEVRIDDPIYVSE